MKLSPPPRPVGRPRSDLASALRNRCWGHAVYRRAHLSWDALDTKLLSLEDHPDAPRPRKLWHVARLGISPRPKAKNKSDGTDRESHGADLVVLVDHHPEFVGLREAFESPFWELLTPPAPDRADQFEIQRTLLTRLGLYQFEYPLRPVGAWLMPAEPAFRPWDGDATCWLRERLQSPTLDLIAVLVGAFRDAMDRLELLEANSYLGAAREALRKTLQSFNIPKDLGEDITRLVDKRLFRSDWSPPFDSNFTTFRRDRRAAPQRSLTPQEVLHEGIAGDVIPDFHARAKSSGVVYPGKAPIVPLNDELRWLLKHRTALYELYSKGRQARHFHFAIRQFETLHGDEEKISVAELSRRFGLPE